MHQETQAGQILYISHGGGPMPILNDPTHEKMIDFMNHLPEKLNKPKAIVVFSAHWEENMVTIQSGKAPGMVYDYYGFPEASYQIKYPCKGHIELAKEIAGLFEASGVPYQLNDERPYDHGSYIPLIMMYPEADIPVIQVSLNHNLDAKTHLEIGKALRPLMKDNILFIGSGFSFHNMRHFDFTGRNAEDARNNAFQNKLIEICCNPLEEEGRWSQLINWEHIEGARYCHPREEHLLPLHICVGLSTQAASKVFDDYITGKRATGFLWK
jgi:aromatic ring-opening dioxygenase catalytic subunit (LigB family)